MSGIPVTVIRRATAADAEGVAQVRVQSWRVAYRGLVPDEYLASMRVEESIPLWQRVLAAESDAACTFVAEQDGEIVGFASGVTLAESKLGFDAELTAFYVLPQAQRKGLATQLIREVAATLQQAGATGMVAWVLAENRVARDCCLSLGGEVQTEQTFTWDEFDLKEVSYGWHSLALGQA